MLAIRTDAYYLVDQIKRRFDGRTTESAIEARYGHMIVDIDRKPSGADYRLLDGSVLIVRNPFGGVGQ